MISKYKYLFDLINFDKVTKQNVGQYLESLVEFYLIKYHEEAIELLKEGFSEVFPFIVITFLEISSH